MSHPVVVPAEAGIQDMDTCLCRYDEEKSSLASSHITFPFVSTKTWATMRQHKAGRILRLCLTNEGADEIKVRCGASHLNGFLPGLWSNELPKHYFRSAETNWPTSSMP